MYLSIDSYCRGEAFMSGNRRRSHIHFIRQYKARTGQYTGTRIVIFKKGEGKWIYDLGEFKLHSYTNSKTKKHSISAWKICASCIEHVIRKEMQNESLDGEYRMYHILYESPVLTLEEFIPQALREQGVYAESDCNISV